MVTTPTKPAPIPAAPADAPAQPVIRLRLPAEFRLSDDDFLRLCSLNDGWLFETDPEGTLLMMTGAALPSSRRAVEIIAQLWLWLRSGVDGVVCDGAAIILLPDGSRRSPDAGWISDERRNAAQPADNPEGVWPVTPDFVVEIVSYTDNAADQQRKMQEVWLANGVRLGWLIDPFEANIHIYRPNAEVETQHRPAELADPEVLPNLTIDLSRIWA